MDRLLKIRKKQEPGWNDIIGDLDATSLANGRRQLAADISIRSIRPMARNSQVWFKAVQPISMRQSKRHAPHCPNGAALLRTPARDTFTPSPAWSKNIRACW